LIPLAPLAAVRLDDAARVMKVIQERIDAEAGRAQKEWVMTGLVELLALR
jgi:hypothetical protein